MAGPTITELRDTLWESVQKMQEGTTSAAACNAISNGIGKILSSVKLEMEYYKLVGKQPEIPMLMSPGDKKDGK